MGATVVSLLCLLTTVAYVNGACAPACAANQQCCEKLGRCYDPSFETCCGESDAATVCLNWQTCCGGACCDGASQKCLTRPTAGGADLQQCSRLEFLNAERVVMVVCIPVFLTLAAIGMLLLSYRQVGATAPVLDLTQKLMVFHGFAFMVTGSFLHFSPLWYYGLLTCLVGAATVAAACSRSSVPSAFALGMQYMALLVYTNPFQGNVLLQFQPEWGLVWRMLHTIHVAKGYHEPRVMPGHIDLECSGAYYDYFKYDNSTRDPRLYSPNDMYFGYCSPGWLTFLLFSMAVTVVLSVSAELVTVAHYARTSSRFGAAALSGPLAKPKSQGQGADGMYLLA